MAGIALSSAIIFLSCSKSDNPSTPSDPCEGVNISVSATSAETDACATDGSITVTASGSSNLTYSINGTSFQSSNTFSNVAKGTYTVTVRNAGGCTGTAQVTVNESGTVPGPLFTAVKQLIQANCLTCHQPGGQQPSPNFLVDCTIAAQAQLIKTRAVDQGTMPPTGALAQTEKDKITAWVAAGGKIED
jgi:uncharacterized membrane protein